MRMIDADACIADIEERLCKPCKEKGLDYHGCKCRACWVDDTINEFDGYADNPIEIPQWIPIKWHNITDEERERESYPKEWVTYLDSEMPEDGQEILVQTKHGDIRWDVCYIEDGFSLDSGWDWVDDIIAWMPLPQPYKEEVKK